MKKNIINILLVVCAYSFLIYKLVNFDNYNDIIDIFINASFIRYLYLVSAIILFPINILAEALKWKYLIKDIKNINIIESQKQVYYGYVGAFITPARLGEYPTRSLFFKSKQEILYATALGFVGSAALMSVMIMFGILALPAYLNNITDKFDNNIIYMSMGILLLILLIMYLLPKILSKLSNKNIIYNKVKEFRFDKFLILCAYSLLRYIIYICQMIFVMRFVGINISLNILIICILVYYMLVTITPSLSVADPAIRGSWALLVFSSVANDSVSLLAALAAVILWVINTVFPMIVGSIIHHE